MQDSSETLALVRNLLESQKLAVLSTQDHGQPYSNLIAIAATDNLKICSLPPPGRPVNMPT